MMQQMTVESSPSKRAGEHAVPENPISGKTDNFGSRSCASRDFSAVFEQLPKCPEKREKHQNPRDPTEHRSPLVQIQQDTKASSIERRPTEQNVEPRFQARFLWFLSACALKLLAPHPHNL